LNAEQVSGPVLLAGHDVRGFSCGEPALDEFLRRYAKRQQTRGASKTYVALREGRVAGSYTIALKSLEPDATTEAVRTGFGNYPVPVVLLARLAVDEREQKGGLGKDLLKHAMLTVLRISDLIGIRAMFVEAKHDEARGFYEHFGFESHPDNPLHLFMTVATIRKNAGG
jgi:GNAT superfamily N-acetyltransferase